MQSRPCCPQCERPAPACWCHAVRPVAHQVQVAVLQHPQEVHEAKGTARLALRCLAQGRCWVGESFAAGELHDALHAPWTASDREHAPRQPLLLYPPTAQDAQHPMATPAPLPPLTHPERLRLVVLDGTWRKSRKLLHCNPALQQLPRLALQPQAPSRYGIRKAQAAHQLSTIEAIAAALAQLEPDNAQVAQLGQALQDFVALQQRLQAAHQRSAMLRPSKETFS